MRDRRKKRECIKAMGIVVIARMASMQMLFGNGT
jgi:hypothetical protein